MPDSPPTQREVIDIWYLVSGIRDLDVFFQEVGSKIESASRE